MKSQPEQVLDTCLAQLNNGQDLEAVLAGYPDEADELRPMLVAAALMRLDAPAPLSKAQNKEQLLATVAERRRVVERANGIVVEVKAGVPVRDLLARCAPELKPLVLAAWRMYTTPAPAPSAEKVAVGRVRIMAMAAERRAARQAVAPRLTPRTARTLAGLRRGLRPAPTPLRRAWSGAVAALLIVAFVGATAAGVGTAAASSLPGDSFYGVKELRRSAQVLFAFDPARRAELHVTFADQRLREMEALALIGRTVPAAFVEQWLASQSRALDDIQRLPMDQRELLAEMLYASIGDGRDLEQRLRGAMDADALRAALERTGAMADEARGVSGTEARATEDGSPRTAPPSPRALPDEKTVGRGSPRSGDERAESQPSPRPVPEVAAPLAEGPEADRAGAQEPAPQVVQPGGDSEDRSSGEERRSADRRPVGSGSATEPPATATEPPPAYNQPIFEDPTLTPEPPATPGASQAQPPSLPVEPRTPEP